VAQGARDRQDRLQRFDLLLSRVVDSLEEEPGRRCGEPCGLARSGLEENRHILYG
jgi:hypothetical protein